VLVTGLSGWGGERRYSKATAARVKAGPGSRIDRGAYHVHKLNVKASLRGHLPGKLYFVLKINEL
jgi:hypothetical protein